MAERLPVDEFRRALAGAARAIAWDPEVEVVFASEGAAPPARPRACRRPVRRWSRGLSPRRAAPPTQLALRLRHHDPALHARFSRPTPMPARCSMRSRRRGSRRSAPAPWAGSATTLPASPKRGCAATRSSAPAPPRKCRWRPRSALIARERLTGEAPPQGRAAGLELVAPWIEDKAAAELDALALTLDDQAAFARLSRRLLEDLDLAAAEELVEESPRKAATTRRARTAAATTRPSEGDEGDARRRRRRNARRGGRGRGGRRANRATRWRPARSEARRRRARRQHLRLARPAQLGAVADHRLQGLHDPLRRDRRGRGAVRQEELAGCAPISTSRWAACRTSSPGSPTGFSGGCWRSRRAAGTSTRRKGCSMPRGWPGSSSIPRHALSLQDRARHRVPRHRRFAPDRQFGLDARAADRHCRDLRRHPRAHAGAMRRATEILGFTTRGWKGGQSREAWLADGRPANPGTAQRPSADHLQARRRALPPRPPQPRADDARRAAEGEYRRRGAAMGAQPADRAARGAAHPDGDLRRRAGRRFDRLGQRRQLSRAAFAAGHRMDREPLERRADRHRHRPRRDPLLRAAR